ncbi:MAG TPA: hypothetical protein VM942_08505 [Acidimicrobiales bacterium]|nr:hypothetical protein [Acidimicrobiales bacterium]
MTDSRQATRPSTDENAVWAVVSGLTGALGRAGTLTASGLGEAIEAPARILTRRAAEAAVAAPRPLADQKALTRALSERSGSPLLGSTAATALAARVARRFGPLKFLARRTPMWVVAAAGPAFYASVTWGADEVGMVASHLVHKVRAAGLQPDPERVWRAAVQVVSGATVDTGADPRHGALVVSWLKRAVKAALPFGATVATRDPASMASAAASIHPAVVARADEVG